MLCRGSSVPAIKGAADNGPRCGIRTSLVNPPTKPPRPEPTTLALIVKGIALIIGAFLSADVILSLHYPFGH